MNVSVKINCHCGQPATRKVEWEDSEASYAQFVCGVHADAVKNEQAMKRRKVIVRRLRRSHD